MAFASDSFTGTAGTELNAYNSAWSKQTGFSESAQLGVDSGTYAICNSSAVTYAIYQHSASPASADYSVFADLTQLSGTRRPQFGVSGRMAAGAGTFYSTLHVVSSNQTRLYKCVSGSFTQLGSSYSNTIGNGNTQTHELRMAGTSIKALVGATTAVSVTDSSITSAGKAGIMMFDMRDLGIADTGRLDNFSGVDAGGAAYTLTAETGAFTLTGNAAGLAAARQLTAAAGAFTLAGQDAGLKRGYPLAAGTGTFALTGQDAALTVARQLAAGVGAFTLTGIDAGLIYTPASGAYTLTADTGAFALTGNPAGLTVARKLTAAAGAFALTGQDATLTRSGYRLVAGVGEFTLVGNDAALSTTGAVERRSQGAGRPSRDKRRRVVEIDGEDFIVSSAEEAEALLDQAREQAKQLAATAVKRAAAAERRPVRKVIQDARRLLVTPEITAPDDLLPLVQQAQADIAATYASAIASVEIAALLAKRQREEEDDEDVLLLIA